MNETAQNNYPLVTVFTLIYNTNPKYIIEAIESVRENNYPNIQHIIIDDCSPNPEPKEIVKSWIEKENYHCEFYEHEINYGLTNTLNHVLELSKGEFILGCSDDILMPDRIIKDVEFFKKNENVAITFGKCVYINEESIEIYSNDKGEVILEKSKKMPDSLLKDNFIIAPTVTFRKKKLIKIGGFQTEYLIEDYPTWLEFVKQGCELSFRNEYLVKYRIHSLSFSQKNEFIMLMEDLKIKIHYSSPQNVTHIENIRSLVFKLTFKYPKHYKEIIKIYGRTDDNKIYHFILFFYSNTVLNFLFAITQKISKRIILRISKK